MSRRARRQEENEKERKKEETRARERGRREREKEIGRARRQGKEEPRQKRRRKTRLLAVLLFWFWFLGFPVLVYISLTGAFSRSLSLACARLVAAAARCHLHTRNKSNNKIIMARGNASYLSLAIVYRRLSSCFFKLNFCPPCRVATLPLRYVRPFARSFAADDVDVPSTTRCLHSNLIPRRSRFVTPGHVLSRRRRRLALATVERFRAGDEPRFRVILINAAERYLPRRVRDIYLHSQRARRSISVATDGKKATAGDKYYFATRLLSEVGKSRARRRNRHQEAKERPSRSFGRSSRPRGSEVKADGQKEKERATGAKGGAERVG